MYSKENEKAAQIIRWIRESNGNQLIWDILCGDSWYEFTVGDCIEMMENTAREEIYEFTLILISRLARCRYMDAAITNIIINRINEPNPDCGIITECIKEFKNIAEQKGIMEANVEE